MILFQVRALSDPAQLDQRVAREVLVFSQDQLVVINPDGYEVTSFTGGEPDFREYAVQVEQPARVRAEKRCTSPR